jgi:DNA-binding beta-propeller fold protein YncE
MEIIGQEGNGKLEFKSPAGITINSDGHLVITEIDNNRLQILTKEFTHIRTIIGFREPRDVYFTKNKHYLITDNHKLIILDEDFHKIEVIGSNKFGKGRNLFHNPTGITIDNNKNEIIICDTNNDRLVIISHDYKWIREINTGVETSPRYICIRDNILYVTSDTKSCILTFNKITDQPMNIIPELTLGLVIDGPRSIRYIQDLLFVTSSLSKSIFVFTIDGEYRGELRHELFAKPIGIFFIDDSLYVTDSDKHALFHFSGVLQ